MKKPSIKNLKKKAWKVFSEWIRHRDIIIDEDIMCVTCFKIYHWKNVHAGHFIHGHSKMTFMDERNVHAQCIRCNRYLHGNLIEYYRFMNSKYGVDIVESLRELSHQIWKPTRQELEDIIKRYTLNS